MGRGVIGTAAALVTAICIACAPGVPGAAPSAGSTAAATPAPDARPVVTITGADARARSWRVELAVTEAERSRGLMHRAALTPGTGMWFVFPAEEPVSFWMRNTRIPLDLVFVSAAGTVVRTARGVPYDDTPIPGGGPVRYVLEVNAGEAADVRPGDRVTPPVAP